MSRNLSQLINKWTARGYGIATRETATLIHYLQNIEEQELEARFDNEYLRYNGRHPSYFL